MTNQGTLLSATRHSFRWMGAALVAASVALAPAWASAKVRSVSVATANFRAGPSTKHPIIFSADRFYPVEIIDQKKDWVRIRDFEGDEAWVAGWLLCDTQTIVVTRKVVNVREKPTRSSTVVHTAERGAVFKTVGKKGSWLKVADEEGDIGWIHRNLVWGDTKDEKKAAPKKAVPEKDAKSAPTKAADKEPPKQAGTKDVPKKAGTKDVPKKTGTKDAPKKASAEGSRKAG